MDLESPGGWQHWRSNTGRLVFRTVCTFCLNKSFVCSLALRVEWCKARSRAHRWQEECLLLAEEMSRVLRFFTWQEKTWREIAERDVCTFSQTSDRHVAEGRRAYALRQASIREDMRAHCIKEWKGLGAQLQNSRPAGAVQNIAK